MILKFKVGKYEFNNEQDAIEAIDSLGYQIDEEGNKLKTHKNDVIVLKYITIKDAVYDNDDNLIEEAIKSDKYSVDVVWNTFDGTEPEESAEFAPFKIDLDNEGAHSIMGVSYLDNKI